MRALIAALVLLVAAPAEGAAVKDQRGKYWEVTQPPPRWFNEPLLGEVVIFYKTQEYVTGMCSGIVGKFEDFGCAAIYPGWQCQIYLSEELPDETIAAIQRHELAHCHGWPADHPTE